MLKDLEKKSLLTADSAHLLGGHLASCSAVACRLSVHYPGQVVLPSCCFSCNSQLIRGGKLTFLSSDRARSTTTLSKGLVDMRKCQIKAKAKEKKAKTEAQAQAEDEAETAVEVEVEDGLSCWRRLSTIAPAA